MYKRIMVAVDESFMTDQVLHAAIELARSRVRSWRSVMRSTRRFLPNVKWR
jgi:hypothetical protein